MLSWRDYSLELARTGSVQRFVVGSELIRNGKPIFVYVSRVVDHCGDERARRGIERDKIALEARYA